MRWKKAVQKIKISKTNQPHSSDEIFAMSDSNFLCVWLDKQKIVAKQISDLDIFRYYSYN